MIAPFPIRSLTISILPGLGEDQNHKIDTCLYLKVRVKLVITLIGCHMKWRISIIVFGIDVGTMFNKIPNFIHITWIVNGRKSEEFFSNRNINAKISAANLFNNDRDTPYFTLKKFHFIITIQKHYIFVFISSLYIVEIYYVFILAHSYTYSNNINDWLFFI